MGYRSDRKQNDNTLKNITNNNQNRVLTIGIFFTLFIFILIGRLFYIQLIKGNDYNIRATSQWFKEIPIGIQRGNIYDRNMIPLTNRHRSSYLVIFPDYFSANDNNYQLVSDITTISPYELKYKLLKGSRPVEIEIINFDMNLIKKAIGIRGVFPIESEVRYDDMGLASHVIGYINKIDNTGAKGIERRYDEILKENQIHKIGAMVDAQKRMIPGLGYKILMDSDKSNKRNVVTTLDYAIENIVEDELDRQKIKGSVVVLEVDSGDILAMASRPNFEQDHVVSYLASKNRELFNRSIQMPYPPGSIFKIIVAAAALENEYSHTDEHFFCEGYEALGDVIIKCSSFEGGGHGNLSLEDAFSVSCNSAFIQLGQRIGGEKIIEMAKKFGLGTLTNIGLSEEIPGQLATVDYMKGAGIGNISIGQGTLEVTPLQIGKITSIIANDGIDNGVQIVKKIIDDNGNIVSQNKKNSPNRVISKDTALKLRKMMEKVVDEGTGRRGQIVDIGGAGGKTGSAEAISNGKNSVHAWFTGYYPKESPKYVITIIVEDGGSGGKVAAPLFKTIAEKIEQLHRD